MKLLIDTNVLVDQLRGFKSAVAFGSALPEDTAISVITVAEIHAGVRSEQQHNRAAALIETYQILQLDAISAQMAGHFLRKFAKSHSLNFADAAIAATAATHHLQLITLNTKHFPMFPGLKKPY
ncbi:MAG: type II toxin-antitoxin system VapC family toxin [Turneriella sp.]|nr:type II toxin-antitoxin system VapC family toxin [Turneriella sp.]